MGPSRYNFAAISRELEEEGALFEVSCTDDLAQRARELFAPAQSAPACEAGLRVVERNRGALDRLILQVERHLL